MIRAFYFTVLAFLLTGCLSQPVIGYDDSTKDIADISIINIESGNGFSGKIKKITGKYYDHKKGDYTKVHIESPRYDYQNFIKLMPGSYLLTAECYKYNSFGTANVRTTAMPSITLHAKKGQTYHIQCETAGNNKLKLSPWLSYQTPQPSNLKSLQNELHAKLGFPLTRSMFKFNTSFWSNDLQYTYYSFTDEYLGAKNFKIFIDEIKAKKMHGFIEVNPKTRIISFDRSVRFQSKNIHKELDRLVDKYARIASREVKLR